MHEFYDSNQNRDFYYVKTFFGLHFSFVKKNPSLTRTESFLRH